MMATISVVSPMYNVGRYLDEYFDSLLRQTCGFDRLEVLLVDDGSLDDTAERATAFAARHPNVTYLRKENGGQASARNLGLEHATGEWVTFPDPDDVLSPNYFADVLEQIESPEAAGAAMFTARMLLWHEARSSNQITDTHALAWRFAGGTRLVDLTDEPHIVQAHVTTGFLRRDVLIDSGIRFREELRVRFEDGNLVTRYLMQFDEPVVGLVSTSEYLYRQRADASSTIQAGVADPRKYTDTVRYGYLDVVDAAKGPLPRWAQNLMVYDLLWLFRSSQTPAVRRARFPVSMHDEVADLLPQWLAHIDEETLTEWSVMHVPSWMTEALVLLKRGSGHTDLHFGSIDAKRGLVSVVYRYRGERPSEVVRVRGSVVEPRYVADVGLEYLGRRIVWQRYLWLPVETGFTVELGGVQAHIDLRANAGRSEDVDTGVLSTRAVAAAARAEPQATLRGLRRVRRRGGLMLREAKAILRERPSVLAAVRRADIAWRSMSRGLSREFAGAWVFIDRDVDANDSAEILYRWVQRERPEINSWFVLRRESSDWPRLEAEGFRLVAYGTARFAALMMAAEHVASSHADRFITDPLPKRFGRKPWNFTFLQHGVIKGDISGWLNPKRISTFVTSTEDEYDYISGPSPFRFGPKEVRLTGLPRFDALLAQDAAVSDDDRDIVLVMPTWRDYLVGAMVSSSRDRAGLDDFLETRYARALRDFLIDPALQDAVTRRGMRVVFMPHPNMRVYLDRFDLPSTVQVVSYDDVDVREMIARAQVLVTDYSSVAFNMAYVQRPVVYFQFDRDDYYTGHTERPGYFAYETHGFGPIVETAAEAAQSVEDALSGHVDAQFRARMERTFPVRDGQNSRRVFEAMVESRTMRSLSERSTAAPPDRWADLA